MKRGKLIFALFVVLFSGLVAAGDVGYVYKNLNSLDREVVDFLSEIGREVDLINSRDLVNTNLGEYDFVLVGDERFRKGELIDVSKYPSVVMNSRHLRDWGIASRGGRLVANAPLRVKEGRDVLEVYTDATGRRSGLHYYFIRERYMKCEIESVAEVYTGRLNRNLGDVIGYIDAGTLLGSGEMTSGNICFFGIIKSEYWTDEARSLFRDCIGFVTGGGIVEGDDNETDEEDGMNMPEVNETENGGNETENGGNETESEDDGNRTDVNRTEDGNDTEIPDDGNMTEILDMNETDEKDGTENGNGVDTENRDVGFVDFGNAINGIRLQDSENNNILEDDSLMCGERYKVRIKVKNHGEFNESISFFGGVGGLEFMHEDIRNLEVGETSSQRTKTVEFDLAAGNYKIRIDALIDGDVNLEDNRVERDVDVVCI